MAWVWFYSNIRMRRHESYKCELCGNVVKVQEVDAGELHCCGQAMSMITVDLTLVKL